MDRPTGDQPATRDEAVVPSTDRQNSRSGTLGTDRDAPDGSGLRDGDTVPVPVEDRPLPSRPAFGSGRAEFRDPGTVATPGAGGPVGMPGPAPAPPPRRDLPRAVVAAIVVGILMVSGAVALSVTTGALARLNPFRNGVVKERTIDRSGPAVLKAINDLGEFKAASGYYELVVDVEKDVKPVPSFLAGKRTLFIAAGTVDVGVDLRGLGDGAIKVNPDRTSATITLPRPQLGEPALDLDRSHIFSEQRGLVDRLRDATGNGSSDDQRQLYALATRRLAEAAAATDELNRRGEANTRAMLEGLLHSLGFTDVTVVFTGAANPG